MTQICDQKRFTISRTSY